jgi:hypothetical protein
MPTKLLNHYDYNKICSCGHTSRLDRSSAAPRGLKLAAFASGTQTLNRACLSALVATPIITWYSMGLYFNPCLLITLAMVVLGIVNLATRPLSAKYVDILSVVYMFMYSTTSGPEPFPRLRWAQTGSLLCAGQLRHFRVHWLEKGAHQGVGDRLAPVLAVSQSPHCFGFYLSESPPSRRASICDCQFLRSPPHRPSRPMPIISTTLTRILHSAPDIPAGPKALRTHTPCSDKNLPSPGSMKVTSIATAQLPTGALSGSATSAWSSSLPPPPRLSPSLPTS